MMNSDYNGDEGMDAPIILGEALCISDVMAFREQLRAALDFGRLDLDGSALEQVDAAGIQLLCAAVRDARHQERMVTWKGVSPQLRTAVQRLGLEKELNLEEGGQTELGCLQAG